MSLYLMLKFLHVLAAMIAVGTNATYGLLLARAHREPAHLSHVRESVRALDRLIANPAYAVVLVTGLLLVWVGPVPLAAPWLLGALLLFLLVAILGLGVLTPLTGRQSQVLRLHGPEAPEYTRLRRRINRISGLAAALVLLILFLMVVKPRP
jgi:uncharacterized membrane protein